MIVANPLLNMSDFRTQGSSRYTHGGAVMHLGIAGNSTLGYFSPIEVNFAETNEGASTRGSNSLNRFYVVKQNLINERLWHWTPTRSLNGSQSGSWNMERSEENAPDDPDPVLVTFNSRPAEVSFMDSPGFMIGYLASIPPSVNRICALQNFRLWVQVNGSHSQGTFKAANDVLWHHCLCMQRVDSRWTVVRNQSLLGMGELRITAPIWR